MTTKNCGNGPKLVLKDLCEKSFVRNDRLPFKSAARMIIGNFKKSRVYFKAVSAIVAKSSYMVIVNR